VIKSTKERTMKMNMKIKMTLLLGLLLMMNGSLARHLNIKFDANGNMINPDDYLVYTALEADKGGYKNDAMWRLIAAAEYGNKHAQYFIGLLHLQKDDPVTGLAWLQLAGPGISNNDHFMSVLQQQLGDQQLVAVATKLTELKETYNFENAIKKREAWRKKQRLGSRIPGYISAFWRTTLPNGRVVGPRHVRERLHAFVYEYRYEQGEVILKDFETVEPESDNPI